TITDHLARRVAATPEDTSTVKKLWDETFGLERWWFVPMGEPGQWTPAATPIQGQNMLLGFTTRERALDFAQTQGFVADEQVIDQLAMSPADVVAHVTDYESSGIEALIMDADTTGYFAPLEHLPKMWSQLQGPLEPVTDEAQDEENVAPATGALPRLDPDDADA
ncbi:MAG TPA: hypothetical protein VFL99_12815, partial [Segeticoccus sp.]|uniref:hypothetical protein n=1 Tax=Segeticoccus sp. TaxID=2706531 RepID=UPI002D7EC9B1